MASTAVESAMNGMLEASLRCTSGRDFITLANVAFVKVRFPTDDRPRPEITRLLILTVGRGLGPVTKTAKIYHDKEQTTELERHKCSSVSYLSNVSLPAHGSQANPTEPATT